MTPEERARMEAEWLRRLQDLGLAPRRPQPSRCYCGYYLDSNGYCKMCATYPARTGRPEPYSMADEIYESRNFGGMSDGAARD